LGVIVRFTGTTVDAVVNRQTTLLSTQNQLRDVMIALGRINVSGNLLSAPAANLNFAKSSGVLMEHGSNFSNDVNNPHSVSQAALDTNGAGRFRYVMQDGTISAELQSLTPNILDDGSPYPGTTYGNNDHGVHRVFVTLNNVLLIAPAQNSYGSASLAENAISTETFVISNILTDIGTLIGYIRTKGNATDLQTVAEATFLTAGKFGNTIGGIAGGTQNLQSVYENGELIITDGIQNAVKIRTSVGNDSDNALEIQNNLGTVVARFTGDSIFSVPNGSIDAGTSITATTGPITCTTGNISATLGQVNAGTTVTAGTGITSTTGDIVATAGQVNAGTTVTAGTGITSTTGDIVATAGQVNAGTTVTAGTGITSTTGDIVATVGQVNAGTTVTAGTGITSTTGNILATTGNVTAGNNIRGALLETTIDDTTTPPAAADVTMGQLTTNGWDGATSQLAGSVLVRSGEAWSVGNNGSKIQFSTVTNASPGPASSKLEIDQNGHTMLSSGRLLGLGNNGTDPTGTREGQLYWNNINDTMRVFDGTTWADVGGGGGGGTETLQDIYDNGVSSARITTDATRNQFIIRRGTANDLDPIFQGENGAGTVTSQIIGTGTGQFANVHCANIVPTTGTKEIGTALNKWSDVYTDALDVTNNISVGGTVDGRDVAADGTAQDNHISSTSVHWQQPGTDNYAFGPSALASITSGNNNIAVGENSLNSLTTGLRNTAIGNNAGASIVNVSDCANIGFEAGRFSTGDRNMFFGYQAGLGVNGVTTAKFCTCIGWRAGSGLTIAADENVLIGNESGVVMTTGKANTCVGFNAGRIISTGSDNVCLGHQSGNLMTTGSSNTLVGHDTKAAITLNNQTALGSGAICDAANQMVLGNAAVTQIRPMSNGTCDVGSTSNRLGTTHISKLESGGSAPSDAQNYLEFTTFDATRTTNTRINTTNSENGGVSTGMGNYMFTPQDSNSANNSYMENNVTASGTDLVLVAGNTRGRIIVRSGTSTTIPEVNGAFYDLIKDSGTSTITDASLFRAGFSGSLTGTITNCYGFKCDALEGTNRYAFYNASSLDRNVFMSNLGIGAENTGAAGSLTTTTDIAGGARVSTGSYTVATLPGQLAGAMIYVSDESGGATMAFSDGTNWRRMSDRAIVS
jgi:hypothetical protein